LPYKKFTWIIAKWIGGYVAKLGGLDMPVFTGGIRENDIASRAEICADWARWASRSTRRAITFMAQR
jgi:acetate kinase